MKSLTSFLPNQRNIFSSVSIGPVLLQRGISKWPAVWSHSPKPNSSLHIPAIFAVRYSALFVLFAASVASPSALALPDELEVHLDDTTKPGQFGADIISNYATSGPRKPSEEGLRPTFHLLQVSPDFSYGVTKNTQVDLQLFSSVGLHGDSRIDGGRIELLTVPIRPDDEGDDGLFLGGLFEVGHLPPTLSRNNLDAEVKGILGYRTDRWTFATNPEIGFKVSGNGSSQPDFSIKFKVAYRVDPSYSVGIEQYSELGQLRHFGPLNQLSQQPFAVVDFKSKGYDFNVGLGRGWNDFSERWVLKAIVSFPFGN
jgi:hypothetical protein